MKANSLNIGILGGSFNPPHVGHLYISHDALQRFKLDYIWWIISPQNPLKSIKPPSISTRQAWCNKIIDSPKIKALDFDKEVHSNKTYDLLKFIIPKYENNNYIWIMGSDNLESFHRWHNWREVLKTVKIAIYNREDRKYNVTNEELLKYEKPLEEFMKSKIPCWSFVNIKTPKISSTIIREKNAQTK